jgi:hypothetical protein
MNEFVMGWEIKFYGCNCIYVDEKMVFMGEFYSRTTS